MGMTATTTTTSMTFANYCFADYCGTYFQYRYKMSCFIFFYFIRNSALHMDVTQCSFAVL